MFICPECNGRGETVYYVETDRDENTVTVEARKGICQTCNGSGEKPQTKADRIRAMSDEELAASHLIIPCFYDDDGYGECKFGWHERKQTCEECKLEWLKQPAEG